MTVSHKESDSLSKYEEIPLTDKEELKTEKDKEHINKEPNKDNLAKQETEDVDKV